ncbi:MAG: TlpA family protein disulfide reductase [Dehalococcoidia bacterium]|nr:TlpA family protein disulfide reductase [Dehalococcoidia bacterium]
MAALPPFSLVDGGGQTRDFPSGRHALLCFLKEDCPTCALSLPLLEAAQAAFGTEVDVWAIGQDAAGNARLVERGLATPLLDDSRLAVSFAYDLDTVPTIILADPTGEEIERVVGFGREDWQRLYARLIGLSLSPAPVVDWAAYPESRPGCGSKSVEPGIAERLAAEAEGSPLRARRVEIGEADDVFEFMFDQGLTDGLPVVPPTPERVLRMLAGTKRHAQEVVATVPPNYGPATVEKVAINAVMAGCRPEYLPVVIAALEAVCSERFNMHGVLATTHFPTPVLIVNGPIRHRLGMNMRMNVLGQGNRANATIGRAVQLVVRNVGGGRPGEVDRAALGQPGKYTFCFPEFEERSNWEPLHVERGFRPEDSTVTAFAGCSPTPIVDQLSRTARSLATSYGLCLATASHPKQYNHGEIVVVVPPEHVDTFARDGWTKDQVRQRIQEVTARPVRELLRDDECAEGIPAASAARLGLDTPLAKFRDRAAITLVVAGGEAGKFGAYLAGWVSGPTGSMMTTVKIEE